MTTLTRPGPDQMAWQDGAACREIGGDIWSPDLGLRVTAGLALADLMDTVADYGQQAQMSETVFESFDAIASAILGVIPDKRATGGVS